MKPEKNLNNKYRVLLTEVLPYELPIVLNNEAFYENMQDENLRNLFYECFQWMPKSWRLDNSIRLQYQKNGRREES